MYQNVFSDNGESDVLCKRKDRRGMCSLRQKRYRRMYSVTKEKLVYCVTGKTDGGCIL